SVEHRWLTWSRAIHAGFVATPDELSCGLIRSALAKHWGSTPITGAAFATRATGTATTATAARDRAARKGSRGMTSVFDTHERPPCRFAVPVSPLLWRLHGPPCGPRTGNPRGRCPRATDSR